MLKQPNTEFNKKLLKFPAQRNQFIENIERKNIEKSYLFCIQAK